MAEVIGTISAVISVIEASIKAYDSAKKDAKLPEMFETVRRRLPIILNTLAICQNNLEPRKHSIPRNVCEALNATLVICRTRAKDLEKIFQKIVPGESDTGEQRCLKVLRRLGKGNKVEELMLGLAEEVQLVINHDAVKSANQAQNADLEGIRNEMKSFISRSDDEISTMNVNTGNGAQTNNVQRSSGNSYTVNGDGRQYFGQIQNFVIEEKEDFSFHKPVGICLSRAPYIAPELFVGRDIELDRIAEMLHPVHGPQMQQRLALGGMGGIGKTRLAIAYAQSRRGSYSSVFWLNAASEVALKESFQFIASLIFDLRDPRLLESKHIIGRVHQWLTHSENTNWLLLFDNYDDPEQFEISDYYPHTTSHGTILITTRCPDRIGGKILHIKELQEIEDSLEVLQTRSKRENVQSDPHAKRLAKRLGGLPLALATAGTYLRQSDLSFKVYLEEYEKRWKVDGRRPINLQEYRERTLYTTWDLSYARLEIDDPDAAKLLKLLAYFGNQSLWYDLFHGGLTEGSPAWLRKLATDNSVFSDVMRTLTVYYFLEFHVASKTWSMHNCMHDWILAELNKDVDVRYYWYAFGCVHATIRGVERDYLGHLKFSRLATHATRLSHQRFMEMDVTDDCSIDQLEELSRVCALLEAQIQLAAAEKMYTRALTGCEKALGPNHTSTFNAIGNLGNLYSNQGKLGQAEQMYTRALTRYEKALGSEHTSTLLTLNNLGLVYSNQGKLAAAEQMYTRALTGYEKALGSEHTSTLRTVNNLGNLYSDQGKLEQAEQMYTRALTGYEKALGPEHISTLRTLNNLGNLYSDQGKLHQAHQMYTRALIGYEKVLGPEHTSTLNAIGNLGNLYSDQGKLDQAEKMYMRALNGYEKALGPEHTSTLRTVNNLGLLYTDQDKLDQAEQMCTRALTGYEKALGPEHTSTLLTVNNLGLLYSYQGKLAAAEQMYIRALTGYEKALGPNHTSTLNAIGNLGNLYSNQGKLTAAEQMYTRALTGYEKALGPEHTSTLLTLNNLGLLYSNQGKVAASEQMYMRALIGYEKALGPKHTSTLRTVNNLGNLYISQGKLTEAAQFIWRAATVK